MKADYIMRSPCYVPIGEIDIFAQLSKLKSPLFKGAVFITQPLLYFLIENT